MNHWRTKFECPECYGSYFGSFDKDGILYGSCHGDADRLSCGFQWNREEDYKYFESTFIMDEEAATDLLEFLQAYKKFTGDQQWDSFCEELGGAR